MYLSDVQSEKYRFDEHGQRLCQHEVRADRERLLVRFAAHLQLDLDAGVQVRAEPAQSEQQVLNEEEEKKQ